ncbi:C39 family peptidase [Paenibacillus filicis]|uniref:C39 family peptidase n=1 Tax=Paenibacillus gyeongsangnamensis TaxID=3388067 RepID=A0ABT4Q3I0_9BACL|nr:C39 family peptidase [Paenibacillus filicis]MCZ8511371.1 C39 family peptidase [Paenibacillus filicis]
MTVLWKGIQVSLAMFLIAGLLFASAVFGILLYARITGQAWFDGSPLKGTVAFAEEKAGKKPETTADGKTGTPPAATAPAAPSRVLLDAPAIRQHPELRSGCEVTSLAMLLQFYNVDKSKMELASELKRDTTPIRWNGDGSIASWGNPNLGFVGDIYGNSKGFGIYHTALFELLHRYAPSAVDLTDKPFDVLEKQLKKGIPSVVWTTINFQVPEEWVVWDTSVGPIRTTFMEHAVLLVGYDEENVYVNDPNTGRSKVKIPKNQFIPTWEAMGRQALSLSLAPNN